MNANIRKIIKVFFNDFFVCFKNTISLFILNWKPIIVFAILNVLLTVYATTFFCDVALNLIISFTNIDYVVPHNIILLLNEPMAIIIILIFFICLGMIAVFEISSLFHVFTMSYIKKKTTFLGMVSYGISICKKVIYPKNWLVIPMIVIILPFTGILNLSGSTIKVLIPSFIEEFIKSNTLYSIIVLTIYLLLVLIVLYDIHFINYFSIKKYSFKDSCTKSKNLMKNNIISTLLMIILFSLVFNLGITAISSTVSSVIKRILSYMQPDSKDIMTYYSSLGRYIANIEYFISGLILPILNVAVLTTLFFNKITIQKKSYELDKTLIKDYSLSKIAISLFSFLTIVVISYNIYNFINNKEAFLSPSSIPKVAAHRGDSVVAPENTIHAFRMAKLEDVDWVELDVHETKDGVIIVSHDDNLKRVSGKDVDVHDLSYAEIQELEVGTWFSSMYEGTRLSTLDEILKLYSNTNIKLQIEIKPTPYDKNIEEKVLEVVNINNMHEQCTILSMSEDTIRRVKELDKTMSTTFCSFMAYGNIQKMNFADNISLEENNITPEIVRKVHSAGKEIFAWTVNNESTVQYLVSCDIDAILTDNPTMMYNALSMANYNGGITKIILLFINRIISGY